MAKKMIFLRADHNGVFSDTSSYIFNSRTDELARWIKALILHFGCDRPFSAGDIPHGCKIGAEISITKFNADNDNIRNFAWDWPGFHISTSKAEFTEHCIELVDVLFSNNITLEDIRRTYENFDFMKSVIRVATFDDDSPHMLPAEHFWLTDGEMYNIWMGMAESLAAEFDVREFMNRI